MSLHPKTPVEPAMKTLIFSLLLSLSCAKEHADYSVVQSLPIEPVDSCNDNTPTGCNFEEDKGSCSDAKKKAKRTEWCEEGDGEEDCGAKDSVEASAPVDVTCGRVYRGPAPFHGQEVDW